jgi:hypothetical protein
MIWSRRFFKNINTTLSVQAINYFAAFIKLATCFVMHQINTKCYICQLVHSNDAFHNFVNL